MSLDKLLQKKFARRTLFKGTGAAALSSILPVLDADAAVDGIPKRVCFFTTPNGVSTEIVPKLNASSPGGYDLGRVLGRFNQNYRNDISYLHGVHMATYYMGGASNDHPPHVNALLTGTKTKHSQNRPNDNPASSSLWEATGMSIDHRLVQLLNEAGVQTRTPVINAGVDVGNFAADQIYKDAGIGNRVPAQNNATVLFNSVFNGVSEGSGGSASREVQQDISMIDSVSQELSGILNKVSVHDRQKIEAHLDGLQAIKTKLNFSSGGGLSCSIPSLNGDSGAEDNIRRIRGENMMDIIAHAFACDQTRVATLQWGNGGSRHEYPSLNNRLRAFEQTIQGAHLSFDKVVNEGHHGLTHGEAFTDPLARELRALIAEWYADRFLYFVNKLASIPEGNGTLLDNTLIVWTSEHSDYGQHGRKNIPMTLAGHLGGTIRSGQYLDLNSRHLQKLDRLNNFNGGHSLNDVYLSIIRAMGFDSVDTFGTPDVSTGVISDLIL